MFCRVARLYSRFYQSCRLLPLPTVSRSAVGLHPTQSTRMAPSDAALMKDAVYDIEINPAIYPQARRDETIVDDFHGTKVCDPYRALEDPDAPESKAFVTELNNIAQPFIEASTVRDKLTKTLTAFWDYEKYGSKSRHGDYYYTFYNSGLQNQSVMYQSKDYKKIGEIFLDVNKLSTDGTTAISAYNWTLDGKLMSLKLSEKGSDAATITFMQNDGKTLPDKLENIKFSSSDWMPKNGGVIYSTYPSFKADAKDSLFSCLKNHSLYYHKMGTKQSEDLLIAEFPERPTDIVSGWLTEEENLILVSTSESCGKSNRLYYHDLRSTDFTIKGKLDLKPLFVKDDFRYDFICEMGDNEALILTNKDAPMEKLIRIKLNVGESDESTWKTIIEEDPKRRLQYVIPFANDKLIAVYLQDVQDVVEIRDLNTGAFIEKLPIDVGSVYAMHTRRSRTELFFQFESFLEPSTVFRADFGKKRAADESLEIEVVHRSEIKGYDPSKYETKQMFYESKDGTKVPMFIVNEKGIRLDGSNPTMLTAYGGFDICMGPSFSLSRLVWLGQMGGVFAQACLRGGGEYGREWHEAGKLGRKQNVFDDFHAAAEYLQRSGYTRPDRLAIQGGSNGGLLMGAVSQQRPELYGAVLNRVGVLDMLRYNLFTIGYAWVDEFGDPKKKEHFEFLYKYSPLHNIRVTGFQQWPATLLISADHDDRVVPAHTLKYVAELYHTLAKSAGNTQRQPILARINVDAGHGSGKPTAKTIEELVDIYCFVQRVLRVEWQD